MTEKCLDFDIVIVGSGAGGGTVSERLAPLCASGARIALLEWGGKFRRQDNVQRELTMAERYYHESGDFQSRSRDLTLAFARAVGGSTTVYTGTSLIAPERVLESWGVAGISAADLAPRYRRYIEENNAHLLAEDEINENNRLFQEGGRRMGWRIRQFPVSSRDCDGYGTCNLGCPKLAKQGTAAVQIPAAESRGVEVIPFCRVDRIEGRDLLAEIMPAEFGLAPSPWPTGRYRIRARQIVLCAGAVNTPALLLRSFGEESLPALGRYFTCHPSMVLAAEHYRPIANANGHPKNFYCDDFLESQRFRLETCMYSPFALARSLAGFGELPDEFLANYDRLQMILAYAVDRPEAHNRILLDREGNPEVEYRFSGEVAQALVAAIRAGTHLFLSAGARRVHTPCSERFFAMGTDRDRLDRLITVGNFRPEQLSITATHLMGGCRMGADAATSVTDSWGRLHGREGVYVADASLFPAPCEVNPSLTVMALADRVAEGIRRDLGERG